VRVRVLRADRVSELLRVLRADWFCSKCDFVPNADGQRPSVSCCALPLLNYRGSDVHTGLVLVPAAVVAVVYDCSVGLAVRDGDTKYGAFFISRVANKEK